MAPTENVETTENATTTAPAEGGAFAKDKLYGKRIDQEFMEGQPFLLLGGVLGDPIDTTIGTATPAKLLVRRVNDDLQGIGEPYVVSTLASAIVEKVRALGPEDVPAIVNVRTVTSKRRQAKALVMELYRTNDADEVKEIAGAFGIELGDHGEPLKGF